MMLSFQIHRQIHRQIHLQIHLVYWSVAGSMYKRLPRVDPFPNTSGILFQLYAARDNKRMACSERSNFLCT